MVSSCQQVSVQESVLPCRYSSEPPDRHSPPGCSRGHFGAGSRIDSLEVPKRGPTTQSPHHTLDIFKAANKELRKRIYIYIYMWYVYLYMFTTKAYTELSLSLYIDI